MDLGKTMTFILSHTAQFPYAMGFKNIGHLWVRRQQLTKNTGA